ncbi:universal stress protein [Actinoplanes auranticolor]|uniref:universal stress protein n=1 Tax=Actinoplanes auranticolor TaxID=47988 RepID=UPI001BB3A233|nr:universal stress protein [Actinoplanes auranticolor]
MVVGFDGSAHALSAVGYGAREALRRGCGLRVVHAFGRPVILPPFHAPYDEHGQGPRAAMLDLLARTAQQLRAGHPQLAVTTRLIDGSPGAVLIEAAREAQLLVLGHRGLGGFAGLLLGSVAAQVAAHARGPVVVVRGDPPPEGAPVVLGTDGSPAANRAAEVAFAEAQLRDVELILAHHGPAGKSSAGAMVTGNPDFWAAAGDAGALGAGARYPDVKYRTEVVPGDSAASALIVFARRTSAGLLVVGPRGLGGFRGLVMGSTSRNLIEHAACPVMVVPAARDAERRQTCSATPNGAD